MPAETSRSMHSSKASIFKSNAEDGHVRRLKGELSCVDCTRLKLKCDRKVPCSSCIRRSCPEVCPNGRSNSRQATTAARRTPFVTERLQEKIRELTQRVRQLEDALSVLQAMTSQEPHPLLDPDHQIKDPEHQIKPLNPSETTESVDETLGSLTIQDHGETFFGPTAGSESLRFTQHEESASFMEPYNVDGQDSPVIYSEISRLSGLFPFLPGGQWNDESSLYTILDLLPDQKRAWPLFETYFEHASLGQRLVLCEEAFDDLLIPLYNHMKNRGACHDVPLPVTPHQISIVFSILSLGALIDVNLPEHNPEAQFYHYLAFCALNIRGLYDTVELATVQALGLIGSYLGRSRDDHNSNMDISWRCLSFACNIAHSIGLHRDPSRWGFDAKIMQRRRNTFWELYHADDYFSLATGRPPNFSYRFIDCQLPEDRDQFLNRKGDTLASYWGWKHRLTLEVHSHITELSLQVKEPNYEAVLNVDAKLRVFPLPSPSVDLVPETQDRSYLRMYYRNYILQSQLKTIATIYLHRRFFVRALRENPRDPQKSKYSPSFLAALRSASDLVMLSKWCHDKEPSLCRRWRNFFGHLFSAAMIFGSVVTRTSSRSMARLAHEKLALAVDLYSKMAGNGRNARYAQVVLDRISRKATAVMENQTSGDPPSNYVDPQDDAELAIFGGRAHINQLGSSKAPSSRNLPEQSSSGADGAYSAMGSLPLDSIFCEIPSNNQTPANWDTSFDPLITSGTYGDFINMPIPNIASDSFGGVFVSDATPGSTWPPLLPEPPASAYPTVPVPDATQPQLQGSEFTDDYWVSLMRDAGLLDSLQIPSYHI